MSQIDQAFIKAYRQQRGVTNAPAEAEANVFQRASFDGQQLRVDAPHVTVEAPPAPPSQRIPTPHLQISDVAPQLGSLSNQSAAAPASQRWSTGFHKRSRIPATPTPPVTPFVEQPAIQQPSAQSEETTYTSVEETLMRLVGIADEEGKPESETVISERVNVAEVDTPPAEATSADEAASEHEEPTSEPEVAAPNPTAEAESLEHESPTVEDAPADATDESPTQTEVAEELPKPESNASFQPAWEVDSFHWPEVVTQLEIDPIAGVTTACATLAGTIGVSNKMLAVTGVTEKVGASTLALLLARGLAKQGLSVALVDADFEQPSLAENLGVRIQDGWEAAIDGRLPLEEVCVASISDGVTLVPLVQDAKTSATSASLSAAELLKQLASTFDFVLIDAGNGSESVAAVATSSEEVLDVSVLLAVDERAASDAQTQEIIARLKQFSIESIQLAQTFVAA